jgi:hypothetical protein
VTTPAAAPAPAASKTAVSPRQVAIAAAVVAAIGLTGFAMSARGGGSQPAPPVSAAAAPVAHAAPSPAASAPAAPVPAAASAKPPVQTWSTENQDAWVDDRQRGAAFELLSENAVQTWQGIARPSLVVRCTNKTIEAFVVTNSPLKIDPRVDGKKVTISMDGEPVRTEHWADSDRHTAVFAPDPASFMQRLRAARMLQVGYSPHNSGDVSAQFHVEGIDALVAASKHCTPKPAAVAAPVRAAKPRPRPGARR